MPSAEPIGTDGELPRFEPTGEELMHQGRFISVWRSDFLDPDGEPFERDIVRHPGAVAIVAVTEADTVVLVQQYRPAVDRWLLEVPAGTCDVPGEPEAVTAGRELAEEAGYLAGDLTVLTRCAVTPGFCDEYSTVYLATGLTPAPLDRHGAEERYMRIVEVPLDRFDELVDDGTIVDATTIVGLALALRRLRPGR